MKTITIEMNEDQTEEWEERAAIMEYDGGLSRAEAEQRAYEIVTRERASIPEFSSSAPPHQDLSIQL